MKKYVWMITIMSILMLTGCTKENKDIQDTDTYNQYTKTLVSSSVDSVISERISEPITAEDVVDRILIACNSEKCLINDWARTGAIGSNSLYNDFYLYDIKTQEMRPFICPEVPIDDTIFRGCMNSTGTVLLFDSMQEQFYLLNDLGELQSTTEVSNLQIDFDKMENVYFSCDQQYVYIANGNQLEILDFDLRSVYF